MTQITANLMEKTLQPAARGNSSCFRLQLHGVIYRPDSFVMMLRYCANLKAIGYESVSLNRIVADNSHRIIVALVVGQSNALVPIQS